MSNYLKDLAKVLRSKNSGPFQITLDVLFDEIDNYERVKKANIFTKDNISHLYNLDKKDITDIVFFDRAMGIKVTMNRKVSSGTCFDRDVYGAQQHAPLLDILIE
ncbi:MAG: DUF4387 domain-containing protein [Sphaerochaetaceae bacterium]|nr:DUF4387 domain-containing protein [Sphaerochaetaceae bacterium]